jgi:hypothetical protein
MFRSFHRWLWHRQRDTQLEASRRALLAGGVDKQTADDITANLRRISDANYNLAYDRDRFISNALRDMNIVLDDED